MSKLTAALIAVVFMILGAIAAVGSALEMFPWSRNISFSIAIACFVISIAFRLYAGRK